MSLNHDLYELQRIDSVSDGTRSILARRLRRIKLLSPGSVNPKTAKQLTGYDFENYILHLAPSKLSGLNVCPGASNGCIKVCLNTAGRGRFDSIQKSRLRKTLYFRHFRAEFLQHLAHELALIESKSKRQVAVRLNGTSDINWVKYGIPQTFPSITFYDYTKVLGYVSNNIAPNYHFTFSASESNDLQVRQALYAGLNTAIVFRDSLPNYYLGRKVIDGTDHDFRFLDPKGIVVGLLAKGKARHDRTGFVRDIA